MVYNCALANQLRGDARKPGPRSATWTLRNRLRAPEKEGFKLSCLETMAITNHFATVHNILVIYHFDAHGRCSTGHYFTALKSLRVLNSLCRSRHCQRVTVDGFCGVYARVLLRFGTYIGFYQGSSCGNLFPPYIWAYHLTWQVLKESAVTQKSLHSASSGSPTELALLITNANANEVFIYNYGVFSSLLSTCIARKVVNIKLEVLLKTTDQYTRELTVSTRIFVPKECTPMDLNSSDEE